MTAPAVLRVVRCGGCAELEAQVTALEEALAYFAESQNFVDSADTPAHNGAHETGETNMPEVMADAPIRDRHVVTIPPKIRDALGAAVGDALRFKIDEEGVVTIRLMRLTEG